MFLKKHFKLSVNLGVPERIWNINFLNLLKTLVLIKMVHLQNHVGDVSTSYSTSNGSTSSMMHHQQQQQQQQISAYYQQPSTKQSPIAIPNNNAVIADQVWILQGVIHKISCLILTWELSGNYLNEVCYLSPSVF